MLTVHFLKFRCTGTHIPWDQETRGHYDHCSITIIPSKCMTTKIQYLTFNIEPNAWLCCFQLLGVLLLLVVPTNQNEAKIIGSAFLWTTVPTFLTGPGQLNKWRLNICSNIELTNTAFVNSTIITRNIETAVLSNQDSSMSAAVSGLVYLACTITSAHTVIGLWLGLGLTKVLYTMTPGNWNGLHH